MSKAEDALEMFLSSSPYGLNVLKQLLYWPTNSKNYPQVCKTISALRSTINKDNQFPDYFDEEFAKKDTEYYNLCCTTEYTSKALLQRLFMNLLYYKMLDKFVNQYDEISWNEDERLYLTGGGKKKQKGGMKLQDLLLQMISVYTLLASSEGIEPLSLSDTNERKKVLGQMPFSAARTKEELLKSRMNQASSMLDEITSASPWDLKNKTITIAKDVNADQIEYFTSTMEEINVELAELSQTGMEICTDLARTSSSMELFSSDIHMQRLLAIQEELEKKASTLRTADQVLGVVSWSRRASGYALSAATQAVMTGDLATPDVDSESLMLQAHAKVEEEMQMVTASQIENLGYGAELISLCRASPDPRFIISVNETDGKSNLIMSARFGNNRTGLLFEAVAGLIVRIELKEKTPGLSESEKSALKSLKQRNSIIIQSIQLGTSFTPLDLTPGVFAVQGAVAHAKAAKRSFGNVISLLMEELPLDKQASENMIAIRKSETALRQADREQTNKEWREFTNINMKAAGGILSDATANAIDTTAAVLTSVSKGAQNATAEITDVATTAVKGVGKIGTTGAEEIANAFWALFPALIAAGGLAGAAAFGFIWFKRNLFSFSNGAPDVPRMLPPSVAAKQQNSPREVEVVASPLLAPLESSPPLTSSHPPAGGKVTRKFKNKKRTKKIAMKRHRTRKNKKQKSGKKSRKNRNKK